MTALDRRLRRRRLLLLLAALVLLGVGTVVADVLRIRDDLDDGRTILAELDLGTVDEQGGLEAVVGRATDHLEAADRRARTSPVLRALSVVPGVSSQVQGMRELTGAVAEIGRSGLDAATRIQVELDAGSGPAARIAVTQVAADALEDLRAVLAGIELGDRWLVPPLSTARDQLAEELEEADGDLQRGADLVAALEGFLTGPRRYLLLGGNNAEMRSGGIPTTSGIATIEGGAIEVGEFSGATDEIELPEPGVPVPPEWEEMYGFLNGDRGYRTTTATANFPLAASIMAEISARNRYGPVDGVLFVDTVTLQVLLRVVGSVELGGVEYTASNLPDLMLYQAYLRYPELDDNPGRRQLQSDVANAVFAAVNERNFPITTLAGELGDLARSRHLLAWSADPAEQELWRALGADGALRRDTLGVISNQLNASKLDLFSTMEVQVDSVPDDEDLEHDLTMTVTITNHELVESSPYIDGGGRYAEPGEYGSYLVFYLPAGVEHVSTDGPGFVHSAPDGDTFAAGIIFRIPEGTSRSITIEFSVPYRPDDTLTALPTARILPTRWVIGGQVVLDDKPFDIRLTAHGAEPVLGEDRDRDPDD